MLGLYRGMSFSAIILAAGKGTRMKSAVAKPLHQVGGRAMLAWSIDAAKAAGADSIVTVLSPDSEDIQTWLDGAPFAIQRDQNGTGDAVAAARDVVGGDDGIAIIMFADTPLVTASSLTALADCVAAGAAIAIAGFEPADPTGYGRLVPDEDGGINRIVEHKDATEKERRIALCNGGIMAVRTPALFAWLSRITNDNAKGEYYLTDIVELAVADGDQVRHVAIAEEEVMGVNDRLDLARAEAALQSRLRIAAMEGGVTMTAPETVFLSADAVIERDVIIEPHVVIGAGCHIGEGSMIRSFS
ncbi:MAG TPA: bifunctional UDP-N-acetylglucosamine diphosphorylase/glucosamine-1-phosphate N-acetyltransferase GlmU, partial [Alphaproteobacteria bacterium]|nr:bifunctional UDP-N-acetylglucosamine diphosphorylase/glucosamine-1-phosphate N-acetyltransferase GlmU [Alphaproteobacteria bacterium]